MSAAATCSTSTPGPPATAASAEEILEEFSDPHRVVTIESSLEQVRRALVSIYHRQSLESALAGVKRATHGQEGRAELLDAVARESVGPFDAISSSHPDGLMDFIKRERHHEEKLQNDDEAAINCSFSLSNLSQLYSSGLVMPSDLMSSILRDHEARQHKIHQQASSNADEQPLQDAEPKVDKHEEESDGQTSVENRDQYIVSKFNDLNCLAPISYLPPAFDYDAHSRTSLVPALRILLPLAASLVSARAVWLPHNSFSLGPGVPTSWHLNTSMTGERSTAGYSVHPFIMRWPRNRAEMLSAIRQLHANLSEDESDLEPFLLQPNASSNPEGEECSIHHHHLRMSRRNAHRQGLLTRQEAELFLNYELENEQLAILNHQTSQLHSSSTEIDDPPASEQECFCLLDRENETSNASGSTSSSSKKQRCPSSHYVSCSDDCHPCQNRTPDPAGPACCLDHLQLLRGCMWWRCGQSVHLIRLIIERQMRIVETHWEQSRGTNYPGARDWSTVFAAATLPEPIPAAPISPPSPRSGAAPRAPQQPPPDQFPQLAPLPDSIISKLQHALPWSVDVLVGARSAIRPLPSLVVAPLSDGWIGGFIGASSPIF